MSSVPFFSIVVPCLNEEKYLPKLLADLAHQTFTDFEVIVVDGHSSDQTIKKAKAFSKKLTKLSILEAPKRNVSYQRNLGFSHVKTPWTVFMDADNRLSPLFLQNLHSQITAHPRIDVLTCLFDTAAYSISERPLVETMNLGMEVISKIKPNAYGALIGIKTSVAKQFSFSETIECMEDQEYIREVVEAGYKYKLLREPRFVLSLRRFKKGKTLPLIKTYLLSNLYFITDKKLVKKLPEYPMDGGDSYIPADATLLQTIVKDLQNASQKQLNYLKKILSQ